MIENGRHNPAGDGSYFFEAGRQFMSQICGGNGIFDGQRWADIASSLSEIQSKERAANNLALCRWKKDFVVL